MRSMVNSIFIFPSAMIYCIHIQYIYKRILRILQRFKSLQFTRMVKPPDKLQTASYHGLNGELMFLRNGDRDENGNDLWLCYGRGNLPAAEMDCFNLPCSRTERTVIVSFLATSHY